MLGNIPGISSGIAGTAIYQAVYHGIGFQGAFVHGFSWLNSILPGLGRWVKTMMYHGSKGGDELPWADILGQTPGYRAFDPYQFLRRCLIWLRNVIWNRMGIFFGFHGINFIHRYLGLFENRGTSIAIKYNSQKSNHEPGLFVVPYLPKLIWRYTIMCLASNGPSIPLATGRGVQVGTWIGPRSKEPQMRRRILWPSSLSPSAPS